MTNPRRPNSQELQELANLLTEEGHDHLYAARLVENATIAVFENYTSHGAGYIGKVMAAIWEGGPSCYAVYTWSSDGNLRFEAINVGRRAVPTHLPEFQKYVVDARQEEFRKVSYSPDGNPYVETIPFNTGRGRELLTQLLESLRKNSFLIKQIAKNILAS